MITRRDAIIIHAALIDIFGGSTGIRDINALDAALNRPFATFDRKDLYPSPPDKAAAILESIISNHPFIDGNKRTGYVLLRMILRQSNMDIESDTDEKYLFVMSISRGEIDINQIKHWIRKRVIKRS